MAIQTIRRGLPSPIFVNETGIDTIRSGAIFVDEAPLVTNPFSFALSDAVDVAAFTVSVIAAPANRVSTLFAEVIGNPAPPSNRVSTLFAEVIADPSTPPTGNRISTMFAEVIADVRPAPVRESAFLLIGA
jgi:hypothetical protein